MACVSQKETPWRFTQMSCARDISTAVTTVSRYKSVCGDIGVKQRLCFILVYFYVARLSHQTA